MSPVPNANRRNAGFSLVEIMVGLVIGLISMVIIMQLYALFEEQKRTTTSGSDALTNAGFSIFSIERDVRVAGYGFADATGCTVNTSKDTTLNNQVPAAFFKLVPVTIRQGMGAASDTISVLASNKNTWSTPARILGNSTKQTDTEFALNTPVGITQGDLLVAYELGKNCTLFQVTAVDTGDNKITHTNNTWNKTTIFPKDGEGKSYLQSGDAMVYNLGSLMSSIYSIDANSNLVTESFVNGHLHLCKVYTLKMMDEHVDSGSNPNEMAEAIYRIIQYKEPKVHYKVGVFMQKFSIVLKRILPDKVYEKMLMNHYKL